MAADGIGNM